MAEASLGTATLHAKLDVAGLRTGLHTAEREAEQSARKITDSFTNVGRRLQSIGTGLTVGITAPLTALGAVGVRSAMQLETFGASLRVLIGDAERANAVFDELYQFSANTPFDWRSLTQGTRTLAAFQIEAEQIVPTLSRIGDIAAGLQVPLDDLAQIYGRVHVTGRLGMEEVNRLADRGVPIYTELAKQLGVSESSIRDLVSSGVVGFPQLEAVIRSLTEEGGMFFGMMDAQTQTVEGRFARLKDSFEQVTDIVGERVVPAFDTLIGAGQRATDWFVNLDESTQGLFVGLGTTLAVSGPLMVGIGTLVVQLPKVAAGFRAVQLAMGPLFGPAGLIVLGAGAIAGLTIALSGRGDSLDKAVEKARGALADGNSDSLTGALQNVADKLDASSPLRARLLELQGDLQRTGEVGVEAVNAITEALAEATIAPLRTELQALQASIAQRERLLAAQGAGAAQQARIAEIEALGNSILDAGGIVPRELTDELMQLRLAVEGLGMSSEEIARQEARISADRARIAELEQQIADARSAAPAARPTSPPALTAVASGPTGTPGDPITVDVKEVSGRPIAPSVRRAMDLAEAGGPGAGMATGMTAEALSEALMAARTRLGPVATQWAEYLADELEREVARFQGGLAGGSRRVPRTTDLTIQPFARVGGAVALGDPGIMANDHGQALDSLSRAWGSYLDAETERQRQRMATMDTTTTNTDRTIRAERELAMAREAAKREAEGVLASFRRSEFERAQTIRFSGENATTYTQQVQLQARALNLAARQGISLTEALGLLNRERTEETAKVITLAGVLRDQPGRRPGFTLDDIRAGRASVHRDGGAERRARREEEAAERFHDTIVSAGISFTDTLARGLMTGDMGSILSGGFSALGSIIGAIPNISTGLTILSGLMPTVGSIFGGLFGGSRDLEPSRRASGASVRGAPAIDLSIVINQSLSVQSLTDPNSRRAVDGLLDQMVQRLEDTLARNVIPRLDRLEGAST